MSYLPDSKVTHIVIHYSATPIEKDVSINDIDEMHRKRGFREVGYHYYIRKNGARELGRDLSQPGRFETGAHSQGENDESIGICYEGGVRAAAPNVGFDSRTPSQRSEMVKLIYELLERFPGAIVEGHRDMPGAATQCPGFDARAWWDSVASQLLPMQSVDYVKGESGYKIWPDGNVAFHDVAVGAVRLQRGDDGQDVKVWQRIVDTLGFPPGPIDGDFGRLTFDATAQLQRSLGIPVTGAVTETLWRKVHEMVADLSRVGDPQRRVRVVSDGDGFAAVDAKTGSAIEPGNATEEIVATPDDIVFGGSDGVDTIIVDDDDIAISDDGKTAAIGTSDGGAVIVNLDDAEIDPKTTEALRQIAEIAAKALKGAA